MAASKITRQLSSSTIKSAQKRPISGIRKEISKTALPHSEEQLRRPSIYEQLYRFNLHAQKMIEMLKAVRGKPGILKKMSAYYQALVQEVRSLASQDILESMNEVEIKNALLSSRQRKQHEKRLYDES